MTPEAVQASSDGGSVALALASTRSVSWLVKLDAFGAPTWQKEVGCFDLPPGSFAGLAGFSCWRYSTATINCSTKGFENEESI